MIKLLLLFLLGTLGVRGAGITVVSPIAATNIAIYVHNSTQFTSNSLKTYIKSGVPLTNTYLFGDTTLVTNGTLTMGPNTTVYFDPGADISDTNNTKSWNFLVSSNLNTVARLQDVTNILTGAGLLSIFNTNQFTNSGTISFKNGALVTNIVIDSGSLLGDLRLGSLANMTATNGFTFRDSGLTKTWNLKGSEDSNTVARLGDITNTVVTSMATNLAGPLRVNSVTATNGFTNLLLTANRVMGTGANQEQVTSFASAAAINTFTDELGSGFALFGDQPLRTTDPVVFTTVNTGQGANELYGMDQGVKTTDSPSFTGLNVTGIDGGTTRVPYLTTVGLMSTELGFYYDPTTNSLTVETITSGQYYAGLGFDFATAAAQPFTFTIGGTANKILYGFTGSAALDFSSIVGGAAADLTITVTGATAGDTVSLGLPASPNVGLVFNAFVSGANTVTVRANNYTAGAIDPSSATYKVTVHKE